MTRQHWSKQRVIEVLHERQQRGVSLLVIYSTDRALYEAAKRYCGSWQKALRAAGLSPQLRIWNPQRVLTTFQARHQQGLPLHCAAVDKPFYSAACRYFGNWRKALEAAGLPTPPPRKWTPHRVIQAIRKRRRQGMSMERIQHDDRSLYFAACRYYGNCSAALRAAGLPAKSIRRWSRESVISELHTRYTQDILSETAKNDPSLYRVARRLFGSWPAALQAAGMVPRVRRRWTAAIVLEAVKARHRASLPMVRVQDDSQPLYQAARAYFGGWHNAMEVAGLDVTSRKRWPHQRIIAAIRVHHRQGSLSRIWKDDKRLFWAGCQRFGNWQKAMEAAGFTPRRYQRWSKEYVLQQLRARHRLSQYNISILDPPLAAAAVRLFGGLRRAWDAAGIEPKDHRWTEKRIIEAIQDRYIRGLPMSSKQFGNPSLVHAARRQFGSWADALAVAAIPAGRKTP